MYSKNSLQIQSVFYKWKQIEFPNLKVVENQLSQQKRKEVYQYLKSGFCNSYDGFSH